MSMTASLWLRMCSAMRCSSECTTGISRCSTFGWQNLMSNLVSTSPPGSAFVSATRTYGAFTARWSRLKLSTFIFLTSSIMEDRPDAVAGGGLCASPRPRPSPAGGRRVVRGDGGRILRRCPPAVDDTPVASVHSAGEDVVEGDVGGRCDPGSPDRNRTAGGPPQPVPREGRAMDSHGAELWTTRRDATRRHNPLG